MSAMFAYIASDKGWIVFTNCTIKSSHCKQTSIYPNVIVPILCCFAIPKHFSIFWLSGSMYKNVNDAFFPLLNFRVYWY